MAAASVRWAKPRNIASNSKLCLSVEGAGSFSDRSYGETSDNSRRIDLEIRRII
jgi:hypothetical protein